MKSEAQCNDADSQFQSILLILVVTVCTLAALPGLLAAPQLDPSLTPSRRGRWNVFGLLTGDYPRLRLFVRPPRHAARCVSLTASAAAKETKGRDFSRPQAGIAGSLLQAKHKAHCRAIVQGDRVVVRSICSQALRVHIEDPLQSSRVPAECSIGCS
jgi:hypothetical protein